LLFMTSQRLSELYRDYCNAFARLEESLSLDIFHPIVIDGVIQRYEFTYELGWKAIKAFLEEEGFEEIKSPRSAIREAFQYGLIKDGEGWISMMTDRNKTSHIYNEHQAKQIFDMIQSEYVVLLRRLRDDLAVSINDRG
jgi:nucleotidyltransferase substrate binding protein (TIGR01987 family)